MMRPMTSRRSTAGFLAWAVTVALGVGSALAPGTPASAASAPRLRLSPTAGPLAGGTRSPPTGTTFTGASKVLFGTLPATRFTVASATKITAVVPAAPPARSTCGSPPQRDECGAPQNWYTYQAVPTVTAVSPHRGPLANRQHRDPHGHLIHGCVEGAFGTLPRRA